MKHSLSPPERRLSHLQAVFSTYTFTYHAYVLSRERLSDCVPVVPLRMLLSDRIAHILRVTILPEHCLDHYECRS